MANVSLFTGFQANAGMARGWNMAGFHNFMNNVILKLAQG